MLLACLSQPHFILQMCEYITTSRVHKTTSHLSFLLSAELFSVFGSYISYLPLAHIYERANQIACAHYGVAVGFYQGVCDFIRCLTFHSCVFDFSRFFKLNGLLGETKQLCELNTKKLLSKDSEIVYGSVCLLNINWSVVGKCLRTVKSWILKCEFH